MNTLSVHHDDAATMTVTGHLTELRKRLIIAIIATAIGMAVSDYFLQSLSYCWRYHRLACPLL